MYLYETHLHTSPVSKCGVSTVRESLEFYKKLGYTGVFITNHFIDGNINIDKTLPYEDKINFYFSDYEEAARLSDEIGIAVFCGVEMSYKGTDFLVYGLDKQWYLDHPEIEDMKRSEELQYLMDNGALVIHAHPFREWKYIDQIRLFPRYVHGVEVFNGNRSDFENEIADVYAKGYKLLEFSGTDCHKVSTQKNFGGMQFETPIKNELDFVERIKKGETNIIKFNIEQRSADSN